MSGIDRALQADAATPEEPSRDAIVEQAPRQIGRWPLGKPIPVTVTDAELMQIVGRKPTAFFKWKARGAFRFLELQIQIGGNTLYSGARVQQWVDGALDRVPPAFFGRRTATLRTGRPGRPRKAVAEVAGGRR